MHGLVDKYQVDPARVAWFEELYGPDGQWMRFRGAAGYLGTELLRDATRPGRYLVINRVINRWISAKAAARFLAERAEDYERRPRVTAHLYLRELRHGAFEVDAVAAD